MKSKPLAFVDQHENCTTEDWSKVIVSNEFTLQQIVIRKKIEELT